MSSLVPARVKLEVARYLCCGDVRYSFVEVSCEECHDARLVAFSCKGRGWCPSCTTRRAVETGAHLVAGHAHDSNSTVVSNARAMRAMRAWG